MTRLRFCITSIRAPTSPPAATPPAPPSGASGVCGMEGRSVRAEPARTRIPNQPHCNARCRGIAAPVPLGPHLPLRAPRGVTASPPPLPTAGHRSPSPPCSASRPAGSDPGAPPAPEGRPPPRGSRWGGAEVGEEGAEPQRRRHTEGRSLAEGAEPRVELRKPGRVPHVEGEEDPQTVGGEAAAHREPVGVRKEEGEEVGWPLCLVGLQGEALIALLTVLRVCRNRCPHGASRGGSAWLTLAPHLLLDGLQPPLPLDEVVDEARGLSVCQLRLTDAGACEQSPQVGVQRCCLHPRSPLGPLCSTRGVPHNPPMPPQPIHTSKPLAGSQPMWPTCLGDNRGGSGSASHLPPSPTFPPSTCPHFTPSAPPLLT